MKKWVQWLKIRLRVLLGRDILVTPDVRLPKQRFGSQYGGWDVITRNLDKDSVVYSFGVGEDISFDVGLIDQFGLLIHAFDPTPKSINWVKSQKINACFVMHEYGIAAIDGQLSFNPPENPDHVSYTMLMRESTKSAAITVPVKRLSTVMKELGHDHIDLLKMDIEGAEYEVITDMTLADIRPSQLLVEFHHRFPEVGIEKTRQAIRDIRAMGYKLFSVSASNEEYCFIRHDLVKE